MSPVLPIRAAADGTVAGSLLLFAALSLAAPFIGRVFCSWFCPAGVIGDLACSVQPRHVARACIHWVKYLIWFPWILALSAVLARSGGVRSIEPSFATESGLSVTNAHALVIYLIVVALFAVLALVVGRRAGCHTVCWMAPFMTLGRFVGDRLGLFGLRLRADAAACTGCGSCTQACSMSLPVAHMVAAENMEHTDCILCGVCVDACRRGCLHLRWGRPRHSGKLGVPRIVDGLVALFCAGITLGSLSLSGCTSLPPDSLVPPTVSDDPSLPAATIVVRGRPCRIHVREFGDPGQPLLMVAPGSLSDVNPYLEFRRFTDAYHVVVWDLRGNGLSQRVPGEELMPTAMADEFHAVKQLYAPHRQATIVGHSWSADFAAIYVGRYPDDVSQAVLIEPTGLTDEDQARAPNVLNLLSPGYLDMAWLAGTLSPSSHAALDFRMSAMLSAAVRDFFVDKDNPPPWPVKRVGGAALLAWESSIVGRNGRLDYDFTTGLSDFPGECLLVGSSDSPIGADFQAATNARHFAHVRVLRIQDAGHRIITEQWDALEDGLRRFLAAYREASS
jgi:pimeloyl-ACP methyl ester carboxylesterase/NAD-dependent dihydropyrimidine dehydrogenase PreA subunit